MEGPSTLGPRAAMQHLRLALIALFLPLGRLLRTWLTPLWRVIEPPLSWFLAWMDSHAGQMYLLLNAGLYGYAAVAFLLRVPGLTAGRTGLWFVDDPLWHLAWGVTVLVVSLSQLGALASVYLDKLRRLEWASWRFSAVLTAMWATAYWWVVILVSFEVHQYGSILIWGWVVGIHLLFIRNHPVPLEAALAATAERHLTPQEETALLGRLQRMASDDERE